MVVVMTVRNALEIAVLAMAVYLLAGAKRR
jgi:hypothetical protein